MNKMSYKSGYEWTITKHLCENLQNIDRNKTGRLDVSKCYWNEDFWLEKHVLKKVKTKILPNRYHHETATSKICFMLSA